MVVSLTIFMAVECVPTSRMPHTNAPTATFAEMTRAMALAGAAVETDGGTDASDADPSGGRSVGV